MALKKLVFATSNPHKLAEVRAILDQQYEIVGLKDIGCEEDIPETSDTFEGNAWLKVRYVKQHYGLDCFGEDTGLEVDALGGEPGVYTARYAGPARNAQANMGLVLQKLGERPDRGARFRTAFALLLDGQEKTFSTAIEGEITRVPRGTGGFGYDPIFQPQGHAETFAELPPSVKHDIGHRGQAVKLLVHYLQNDHKPGQTNHKTLLAPDH